MQERTDDHPCALGRGHAGCSGQTAANERRKQPPLPALTRFKWTRSTAGTGKQPGTDEKKIHGRSKARKNPRDHAQVSDPCDAQMKRAFLSTKRKGPLSQRLQPGIQHPIVTAPLGCCSAIPALKITAPCDCLFQR